MSLFSSLIRGRVVGRRPYLPFTQPPYPGPYIRRPLWRDHSSISNVYKKRLAYISTLPILSRRSPITGSDRRVWHPNYFPVTKSGRPAVITDTTTEITPDIWRKIHKPLKKIDWRPKHSTQLQNAPWWYGFLHADKTYICLKRKMRREVLHALGVAGQTDLKNGVRGPYSHVRC